MMKKWILWILVLGFIIPQPSVGRAQTPETNIAPYLYYFSSQQNVFILERADGTDGIILGAGLMSPTEAPFGGLKFSPSGEWVAWSTTIGNDLDNSYAYVMRVDGSETVTLTSAMVRANHLEWSPTADHLLLLYVERNELRQVQMSGGILDVAENKALLQLNKLPQTDVYWTPDGQYVAWQERNALAIYPLGAQPMFISGYSPNNPLSPNGQALYIQPNTNLLTRQDFATQTITQIAPLESQPIERGQENEPFLVDWSPDGTMALITTLQDEIYTLYLLQEETLTPLADKISLPYRNDQSLHATWSPDSRFFVYATSEQMFVVDTTDLAQRQTIPLVESANLRFINYEWHDHWLILYESRSQMIYDVDSQTILHQAQLQWSPRLSPDARTFFASASCGNESGHFTTPCFYDITTQTPVYLTPSPFFDVLDARTEGLVHWAADSEWVIYATIELLNVSHYYYAVAKRDGSHHRALTDAYQVAYAGWVPSQFDLSFIEPRPTPIQTAPIASHYGLDRPTMGIAWHPDGTQFALVAQTLQIWDAQSYVLLQEFPITVCPNYPPLLASVSWSVDGSQLAYSDIPNCSDIPTVRIIDVERGEMMGEWADAVAVTALPDGTWLIATSTHTLQIVDTTTVLREIGTLSRDYYGTVLALDYTLEKVAVQMKEGFEVWELASDSKLFETQVIGLTDLTWTPDGSALLMGISDVWRLFDMTTQTTLDIPEERHYSPVWDAYSPDGQWVVQVGDRLRIYDATTFKLAHEFYGNGVAVAWSPDGRQIAVASGYGWEIWATGQWHEK